MNLKKYLTIINAYWQRALTYRFSVIAYRTGELAEIVVLIMMWTAIYGAQEIIQGFTLNEMITYILVGNFINAVVRNYLPSVIARDIKDGRLSTLLLKPMSYFQYILTQELGRMSYALIASALSAVIAILFFSSAMLWNFDPLRLVIMIVIIALSFIIELLFSYLIGLIAFWTDEVDGIFVTFERVKKFFSGGYFPLSLLPTAFVSISLVLPFAYTLFVPAQVYLGKIGIHQALVGIGIQAVWIILLYFIIAFVWNRGLRRYEGVGI